MAKGDEVYIISLSPARIMNMFYDDATSETLEDYVRNALAFGELPPAVETRIQSLIHSGNLSRRDRTLISILRDAIHDGCIHRVGPSSLG